MGKPSGMMGPKKKTPNDKPSAKVNMPAYPGKSDGKKVNMPAKPGKGIGKKVNVSSMGSKDPIGPQTKKEARKSAPKVPMTPSGTAAAKKAKRKSTMTKIAGMGAAAIGGIADMVNTKRRLSGKSYIPTKKKP